MLLASIGTLFLAFVSVRFPDVPLLSFMPAVAGTALAVATRRESGAWRTGILPAAFLTWLPGTLPLALVTLLLPMLAALARGVLPVRTAGLAVTVIPLATYLAAVAATRSLTLPFHYPLDLCAALVVGATLSSLAYAPTQKERFGTGGRAGFRLR